MVSHKLTYILQLTDKFPIQHKHFAFSFSNDHEPGSMLHFFGHLALMIRSSLDEVRGSVCDFTTIFLMQSQLLNQIMLALETRCWN